MLASGGLEDLFWAFWKKKIYHEALAIYYRADRPYWLAYLVGRYFERKGQTQEAMTRL